MNAEKGIKRYEPRIFLLVLGLVVISMAFYYSLNKFLVVLESGKVSPPNIPVTSWVGLGVLVLSQVLLLVSYFYFSKSSFYKFKWTFGISLIFGLVFFGIQMFNLPFKPKAVTAQNLGFYYFSYFSAFHLLLVLVGLVVHGVMMAKVSQRYNYVDSFIYTVNPPNKLNLRLFLGYWGYVTLVWCFVLLLINSYAL